MKLIMPLLILSLLCGCTAAQVRQEFFGMSAEDVRADKNKQVITFGISGPDCVNKIKTALTDMKAIAREDSKTHFIYADNFQKAFRSSIDTTQVGIVVTWLEPDKCQVEIASHNLDLAVFVSKELTKRLGPKQEVPEQVKPTETPKQ